jgi:hypothetical protein
MCHVNFLGVLCQLTPAKHCYNNNNFNNYYFNCAKTILHINFSFILLSYDLISCFLQGLETTATWSPSGYMEHGYVPVAIAVCG